MPEQTSSDNSKQQNVSQSAALTASIDIQALAEKVYRLMREQARLERVRGEQPGYRRVPGTGR
jgi:hypothetical protein